ncbi:zinc finger CCCH domain-containing protein 1-like [Helianthus annuus]|uniref:zinc finger CCCH domain-containing protein 1-like n=1 Tax=Helianthus annuus TaxID=4232 RepID=UPI000B8F427D|nr:zinc finger CCCH domain-containing protein 1-like [Helianthus annuus]
MVNSPPPCYEEITSFHSIDIDNPHPPATLSTDVRLINDGSIDGIKSPAATKIQNPNFKSTKMAKKTRTITTKNRTSVQRKPLKNKNIRKRPRNEQDDDSTTEQEAEPSVIINKKKQITPDNKLHFATAPSKRSTDDQQHPVAADIKATIFQFDSSKEIHGYTDYKAGFRRDRTFVRIVRRPSIVGTVIRGDYKSGWQMEKEWDEAEKARKRKLAVKGYNDDEKDGLPFACFIYK